ncbi:SusD/RagB family nutrient-binding outer membrane lipoprotein [Pseudarcicella hirudinis]|uniref:SusD/RagB family nutrient-binding outer membrane lipoprotein n=1 Tax=Pseudarcicella hirudinis TaxID=1079859 RepID=UPI0035E9F6F6
MARIQYTTIDQYIIPTDVIDNAWRDFFIESQADFQRIIALGKKLPATKNYQAIGLIMRAWTFSLLTDVYGDIPYKDAIQGIDGKLLPKYDSQKDIYLGLITDLKTASDMINAKTVSSTGDIMFAGDMSRWKKFANSLSLKLLNRILSKTDTGIDVKAEMERILKDPAKYPVFTSYNDCAFLTYLGDAPNNNPINQNRKTRDDHRVSLSLTSRLQATNDSRITIYAEKPEAGGDYLGIPNGLNVTEANALGLAKTSRLGKFFTQATAPAVLMSYAELLFIKAEAAYKGVSVAGDAGKLYLDGINASYAQYKIAPSDDFLKAVAYKGGADGYKQIMEQKWISLFGEGIEAWTEQRRTGIPDLKAPLVNTNDNVLPTRLPYPSTEETLNGPNMKDALSKQGGVNDKKLKLWWAK